MDAQVKNLSTRIINYSKILTKVISSMSELIDDKAYIPQRMIYPLPNGAGEEDE